MAPGTTRRARRSCMREQHDEVGEQSRGTASRMDAQAGDCGTHAHVLSGLWCRGAVTSWPHGGRIAARVSRVHGCLYGVGTRASAPRHHLSPSLERGGPQARDARAAVASSDAITRVLCCRILLPRHRHRARGNLARRASIRPVLVRTALHTSRLLAHVCVR